MASKSESPEVVHEQEAEAEEEAEQEAEQEEQKTNAFIRKNMYQGHRHDRREAFPVTQISASAFAYK